MVEIITKSKILEWEVGDAILAVVYSFKSRVRYSECNSDGTLKLANIVNYFQDCSIFQSKSLGVGMDFLKTQNKSWIILSWNIVINSYPRLYDVIETCTSAYKFDDIFGYRNFMIKAPSGEHLAIADSKWALIDINSNHILKLQKSDIQPYELSQKASMVTFSRKIPRPKNTDTLGKFLIDENYIDTNNHVNNQKYIEIALKYVPKNLKISSVRVEYRKAAVFGDTIFVNCSKIANKFTFLLNSDNGKTYAIIEFTTDNQEAEHIDGKQN